jgi:GNAT superfamily N-acetyltransferase
MELRIRRATRRDVPAIIALLADDALGQAREWPADHERYDTAFDAVDSDPNQLLAVGELAGEIVATMQLTFIPGLSRRGAWRAQIEGVRMASAARGHRLGEQLVRWAVGRARAQGCALVQLTSDNRRADAHRFYQRLGFVASHTGFKLDLRRLETPPSDQWHDVTATGR